MPLSWGLTARYKRVGVREYLRRTRGPDVPSIRPGPLCSDVNNVNGPEVKLICHAGPQ